MEYENKEAKKFVQWFLLCSVIILLLTGTVTTLVVRNYRARENEAVTAMLGIVLKNDGSDTEESRQEKISECMRMLEHPHAYQKSHQKEIKEAKKILESQGAVYRNLSIDSDSAAGKYAADIMAFPTTILVDRNGNIIGEPMLGGIDNQDNYDALMKQIQSVIDADSANK